jgi:hypothetical protein
MPILFMRADPRTGWRMVASREHYTYQHRVRVNALGLRGPEVEPKRPGELRVLALGDSLTYGQGVADDETIPAQLERCLRERDPARRSWSVVNAGHRAYDTHQELELCEELLPLVEPDFVLLLWYWNDLMERDTRRTFEALEPLGEVAFDTGNRVEGLDALLWHVKQTLRRSALLMLVHDSLESATGGFPGAEVIDQGLLRQAKYLERLARLASARGVRPLAAIVPDANLVALDHESGAVNERWAALARERGFVLVDLLETVRDVQARTGELPVIPYDGHYDPTANAAMASTVADQLLGTLAGG